METLNTTIQALHENDRFHYDDSDSIVFDRDNMPEDVKQRLTDIIMSSDSSEFGSIERVEDLTLSIAPADDDSNGLVYLSFDIIGEQSTFYTRSRPSYNNPGDVGVCDESYDEFIDIEYEIPKGKDMSTYTLDELLEDIHTWGGIHDEIEKFTQDLDGDDD